MKRIILFFFVAVSTMGCEGLGLKDENFFHEVNDVAKNDLFVIVNKKQPAFVKFIVTGELSHNAKIIFSEEAPDADTLFAYPREILLAKGELNFSTTKEYYSKRLYIKYVSLNDSTSGNLRIKVEI